MCSAIQFTGKRERNRLNKQGSGPFRASRENKISKAFLFTMDMVHKYLLACDSRLHKEIQITKYYHVFKIWNTKILNVNTKYGSLHIFISNTNYKILFLMTDLFLTKPIIYRNIDLIFLNIRLRYWWRKYRNSRTAFEELAIEILCFSTFLYNTFQHFK